jgi:hypothetical protein
MAAPIVSGIASLLKGYNLALNNDDIEQLIQLSADDKGVPGFDIYYGYGRVNARKALDRLRSGWGLTHCSTIGGTDQGASDFIYMLILGAQAWGLSDGFYIVKRHEVRRSISYALYSYARIWGRGVGTNGWANEGNTNYGTTFCEVVPGSETPTGVVLRTYVYEVWNSSYQYIGYKPTTPGNVTLAYTEHGRTGAPNQPLGLQITNISGSVQLAWDANTEPDFASYEVSRKLNSGVWEVLGTTTSTNFTDVEFRRGSGNDQASYRIRAIDLGNQYSDYSSSVSTNGRWWPTKPIEPIENPALTGQTPRQFNISNNYPNPFNPSTQITFDLPEESHVSISVYDMLGRLVCSLVDRSMRAGYHSVTFEANDLPGGVYFYKTTLQSLETKRELLVQTKKMVLAK